MRRVIVGVMALFGVVAVGCGGAAPKCTDAAAQSRFMSGCESSGTASASFCACGWDELAQRHECTDFNSATVQEIQDITNICMGR